MTVIQRYPQGGRDKKGKSLVSEVCVNKNGLHFLSVAEQAKLLRDGELSPVELTEAYLERVERLNSRLFAYITVTADIALEQARRAEGEIGRGEYRGPLHGIPIAVKDQMWTEGIRTTNASFLLRNFVPEEDATVIARIKEAGVVLLGKLNMSEFASGGRFMFPYGRTRNPWNTDYEPGASSSGSGAAVAAGLCATSLGEDTSGSIRHPSSWCGVVGVRPTWGRVSRYGLMPIIWSMDQAGAMSRTVEDAAITLQPICGYDPKDPNTADVPAPDFRKALTGRLPVGSSGGTLRVGIVKELTEDEQVTPEVRRAFLRAVEMLADLGAEVEEASVPLAQMGRLIFYTHMYVEMPARYKEWMDTRLTEFDYDQQVKFLTGSLVPGELYVKVQKLRAMLRRQVHAALGRFDVLASPTMRVTAPLIKPNAMPSSKQDAADLLIRGPDQTPLVPLSNVPAMNVPCGFSGTETGGMPIGMQLIGRPFREDVILAAAHAYEQATPWHRRRPGI